MPCEHCLSRRDFLATAAGAAGLATFAGCGDGQISSMAPRLPPGPPSPVTVTVASISGLENLGQLVRLPNTTVAVKRTGHDTFDAFSMRCTHQGCLTDIVDGHSFHCVCHGSNFANDGTVVNGPFTGEAIGPLVKLTAIYDPATDQLTIS